MIFPNVTIEMKKIINKKKNIIISSGRNLVGFFGNFGFFFFSKPKVFEEASGIKFTLINKKKINFYYKIIIFKL